MQQFCAYIIFSGIINYTCSTIIQLWFYNYVPQLCATTCYLLVLSREWGMGVAGMIIDSYCGSFPKIPRV